MTGRGRVILALFLLSLLGGIITGWNTYFSLSYLFGGMLIISLLWSRLLLKGLEVKRSPRSARGQMGSPFWETIRIANKSRMPKLWVAVEDRSDLPGHEASAVLLRLKAGQDRQWLVRTLCTRRGRFHLGPTVLSAADPFGLFQVQRAVLDSHGVVVLPMIDLINNFRIPGGILPGGVALQKPTYQTTPNATGVRDYAPGDSLNRIHWRSSARLDRLIAKEFELDPLTDVWILMDGEGSNHFGKKNAPDYDIRNIMPGSIRLPEETEEYCVAAAASLAFHILEQDRAVGFIGYGSSRHAVQSDRGESQLIRILETLAVFDASGSHNLAEVVKIEGARISSGSTVILITPAPGHGYSAAVKDLIRRGAHPVVIAVDASSFGSPELPDRDMISSQDAYPIIVLRNGDSISKALSGPVPARPVSSYA